MLLMPSCKNSSPLNWLRKVSYLVPPATALEVWILFGERLGLWALGGLIVASIGVALVVTTSQQHKADNHVVVIILS